MTTQPFFSSATISPVSPVEAWVYGPDALTLRSNLAFSEWSPGDKWTLFKLASVSLPTSPTRGFYGASPLELKVVVNTVATNDPNRPNLKPMFLLNQFNLGAKVEGKRPTWPNGVPRYGPLPV